MSATGTRAAAMRAEYLQAAARVLSPLPPHERDDLLLEIESHLAESMQHADGLSSHADEETRLRDAIARLGNPREFLRPIVADYLLAAGTSTYRPWILARGLYANLFSGARAAAVSLVFGLAYVLLAIFAAMALLKGFLPRHVGYFIYPDGTRSFGVVANTTAAREALGWWVVPVSLACFALLYVAVTRGLAAVRRGSSVSATLPGRRRQLSTPF